MEFVDDKYGSVKDEAFGSESIGQVPENDDDIGRQRDRTFNELLKDYTNHKYESYGQARTQQNILFYFLIRLLFVLTVCLIAGVALIIIFIDDDIVAMLSGIAGIAATYIMALFKILGTVTASLFPKDGSKQEVTFLELLINAKKESDKENN